MPKKSILKTGPAAAATRGIVRDPGLETRKPRKASSKALDQPPRTRKGIESSTGRGQVSRATSGHRRAEQHNKRGKPSSLVRGQGRSTAGRLSGGRKPSASPEIARSRRSRRQAS